METLTGQTLRGYNIQEQLGVGGFGAVYKAFQSSVGREVAIKAILAKVARTPNFTQSFEAEARLVAKLEHPNIIPLYDFWQDSEGAYIVMRYVRGGSLRDLITRQGKLPVVQVVRILDQIADALSAAHQAGVIHRDLKPANILIDERGNAYLTDFGIAQQHNGPGPRIESEGFVGTPAYLSPEQITGHPASPQSDIYSLGLILYEMLIGEHPFGDSVGAAILKRHMQDPVPHLVDKRPELPLVMDSVLQRALSKDASVRYSDASQLAQEFRESSTATPRITQAALLEDIEKQGILTRGGQTGGASVALTPAQRNRLQMLRNVNTYWIKGVLENSVHGAAIMQLGLNEAANSVDRPWDTLLRVGDGTERPLHQGMGIRGIFDMLNGKMLILGDPGSGKTTTLLELARDLLTRAERDPQHPIPVVLNLASWSQARKPVELWLVDELGSKYQVPRPVARQWVADDALLLLLDGLDEVDADHRNACIQALNSFRDDHGFVDVVVCSRIKDYETLSDKLKLNGAIQIQPLSDQQVDAYLSRFGPDMASLRVALNSDQHLREMSHTPLMLSIMSLAYQDSTLRSLTDGASTRETTRDKLFATYVQRAFQRRSQDRTFTPEQTISYLAWLARGMQKHTQSIFLIENLQGSWLDERLRQRYYAAAQWALIIIMLILFGGWRLINSGVWNVPVLVYGPISLVFGAFWGWALSQPTNPNRITFGAIAGAGFGIAWGLGIGLSQGTAAGLKSGVLSIALNGIVLALTAYMLNRLNMDRDHILSAEKIRFARKRMRIWAVALMGLIGVAYYFDSFSLPGLIMVGLIGLMYAFAGGVLSGLAADELEMRSRPNQGMWLSLRNGLRYGFVICAIGVISNLLPVIILGHPFAAAFAEGVNGAILAGTGTMLALGLYSVLHHVALRYVIAHENLAPHNLEHFLNYTSDLILMRQVGGGYIFIHRYLLEYFAQLAVAKTPETPQPSPTVTLNTLPAAKT